MQIHTGLGNNHSNNNHKLKRIHTKYAKIVVEKTWISLDTVEWRSPDFGFFQAC